MRRRLELQAARLSRSLALAVLLTLLATGCAPPESGPTESAALDPTPSTAAPPLLDREIFFGDPQLGYARLSPDGTRLAFCQQLDGVLNVWVKGIDEPFTDARPVTHDTRRPITGYFWSHDGRYILFAQDQGGNENFRVYAVDPSQPPAEGQRVPAARDLTPYDNVRAQIIALPKSTPDTILVGLNDRDPRLHDVYRVSLETGERQLVRRNDENVFGWVADLDGELRLVTRIAKDGSNEILRVDEKSLEPVYTCSHEETCNPLRFHRDGRRVYLATNRGEADLVELKLFDPESGAEELVERDPEGRVDFSQAIFSEADDTLIATLYTGDRVRIYPKSERFTADLETLRAALPDGDFFFRTPSADDRLWVVKNVLDIDEGPNYLYDRASGEVRLLYRPQPEIPTEHMAPMQAVRYAARDGLEIPAYLTIPKGVEAEGLPAVVLPHGGPWARDVWGFSSMAQFLANRGYAVLQPNFRGSTGYGKKFLNLGNGEWGTGTMQHDISDGVAWLIDEGIADPERVAIMGISYGGYATLAGVAFTPDTYAAGVSIVGPSSIVTLMESIPPYWEPIREMFNVRVGNPSDPGDVERLRAQSPLYAATNIQAPLLVIQGANDPRVKKSESDQIVLALHELGRTVEYLVAEDEGHGFAGELNGVAMWAGVEQFLAAEIGGQAQKEMRPEIAERLAKLRVDIGKMAPVEGERTPLG